MLRVDSTSRAKAVVVEAIPPEPELTEFRPVLRVAVGLDVRTSPKWSVRYSFPLASSCPRQRIAGWPTFRTWSAWFERFERSHQ